MLHIGIHYGQLVHVNYFLLCKEYVEKKPLITFFPSDAVVCSKRDSSITEGEPVHMTCSLSYQGPAALWDVVWEHGDRKLSR